MLEMRDHMAGVRRGTEHKDDCEVAQPVLATGLLPEAVRRRL